MRWRGARTRNNLRHYPFRLTKLVISFPFLEPLRRWSDAALRFCFGIHVFVVIGRNCLRRLRSCLRDDAEGVEYSSD
jgi:hypothetical protein